MANKIQINLKAYEHKVIDKAAAKIVETVKRTGGEVSDQFHYQLRLKKLQS